MCAPELPPQLNAPHTRPDAPGVYPTELIEGWPGYSYWSGKRWGLEGDTPEEALRRYSVAWADQRKPWRNTPISSAQPVRPGTAVAGASVRPSQPAVCAAGNEG